MANDFGFVADHAGGDDFGFVPEAAPAAQPQQPQAKGFVQGLTTNDPTKGFGAYMGRNIPRAVGGAVGATAGVGWASVPTAALGGAAGESARQALVSAAGNQSSDLGTAAQSVGQNVGGAALEQGVGQGAVKAIGGVAQAVGPSVMEAFPRIPSKYSTAALDAWDALWQTKPAAVVKDAYKAFERYTGLQGIEQQEVLTQNIPSTTDMIKTVFKTGQDVINKVPVDPQELYTASQYASRLKLMSKFQNAPPELLPRAGAIAQGKQLIDGALEQVFPEYGSLRADYFGSKMKDAFSNILPRNNNQSISKLGLTAAGGLASTALGAGFATGHENYGMGAAALPLLAMSPAAYGAAIMSAPLGAAGVRTALPQVAQGIYDQYQKMRSANTPRNPAPPLAPR